MVAADAAADVSSEIFCWYTTAASSSLSPESE